MVSYIAHTSNGIFAQDKRVYVDRRLPGMEYAQAGIIHEPGAELLVSYETVVAEKRADGWIHIYGLFSASTRKHLSKWGKLHNIPYNFIKDLYEKGLEYNIETGEVQKAEKLPAQLIGVKV